MSGWVSFILHRQRKVRITLCNESSVLIQNGMGFPAHMVVHISWLGMLGCGLVTAVSLTTFVLVLNAGCLLSSISSTVTGPVAPHVWSSLFLARLGEREHKGDAKMWKQAYVKNHSLLLFARMLLKLWTRVSKDYQHRRWQLVSSCKVTAVLVQLLMAALPEPEHASPALSIYILPPAVHQVVLEENTSTFLQ